MKHTVCPAPADTARVLIERLLRLMNETPERPFHLAVSGGSTPALMFTLWAKEYADATPWDRLRLYWVDERCVAPTDSQSNYRMTRETLLQAVPLPETHIFRIEGERPPREEALRYSELVLSHVPQEEGEVRFDAVLLGVGEDGHTSSVFPGQEDLLTAECPYAVGTQPQSGQKRIAMTGRPMTAARHTFFLIHGRNKARVVAGIYRSADAGPAAYVAHHAVDAELFLDAEAASELP